MRVAGRRCRLPRARACGPKACGPKAPMPQRLGRDRVRPSSLFRPPPQPASPRGASRAAATPPAAHDGGHDSPPVADGTASPPWPRPRQSPATPRATRPGRPRSGSAAGRRPCCPFPAEARPLKRGRGRPHRCAAGLLRAPQPAPPRGASRAGGWGLGWGPPGGCAGGVAGCNARARACNVQPQGREQKPCLDRPPAKVGSGRHTCLDRQPPSWRRVQLQSTKSDKSQAAIRPTTPLTHAHVSSQGAPRRKTGLFAPHSRPNRALGWAPRTSQLVFAGIHVPTLLPCCTTDPQHFVTAQQKWDESNLNPTLHTSPPHRHSPSARRAPDVSVHHAPAQLRA
jgi:hypothetical protein